MTEIIDMKRAKGVNPMAIPGIIPMKTTPEKIIDVVCDYFNVTIDELKTKSRKSEYVTARSVAWYIMLKETKITTERAGLIFSKDHATVLHGNRKVEQRITIYKDFARKVREIERKLREDNLNN